MSSDDEDRRAHVGPPDLILQAIIPPTDAPAEIRAAVTSALARTNGTGAGERSHSWEDVTFAASAIALVEGTSQRAQPDTQWVFALRADSPKLGERVRSNDGWSHAIGAHARGRTQWRAVVYASVTTEPRPR